MLVLHSRTARWHNHYFPDEETERLQRLTRNAVKGFRVWGSGLRVEGSGFRVRAESLNP